jgi:hypothetical protein
LWRWDTAQHFSSYEITLCKSRCSQFSLILIFLVKNVTRRTDIKMLDSWSFFFFFNPVIMVRTGLGDWLLLPLVSLKKNYTKPRLLLLSSLLSFSGAWPLDTCLFFSFLFFSFVPKSTPPLLFFFLSWNAFTIYVEKYCVFHSHIYMKRLYSCWGLDFKYFFK